jgi:hypothetical protein
MHELTLFAFLLKGLTTVFMPTGTGWKIDRLLSEVNLEPLSNRLQAGVRFFQIPIPAAHCEGLETDLPLQQQRYRLTAFREDNRVG